MRNNTHVGAVGLIVCACAAEPVETSSGTLNDQGGLTSGFAIGYPFAARSGHSVTATPDDHAGRTSQRNYDLDCVLGDGVGATVAGRVTIIVDGKDTGKAEGYGNRVCIEDDANRTVCHNHLKKGSIPTELEVGDHVEEGTQIGQCGNSGYVISDDGDGSHLDVYAVDAQGNNIELAAPSTWTPLASLTAPTGEVAVVAPIPGATWHRGSSYTLTWSARSAVRLVARRDETELAPPIAAQAEPSGSVQVVVPRSWPVGAAEVCASTRTATACNPIVIAEEASVSILSPLEGGEWRRGESNPLIWATSGVSGPVRLVARVAGVELAPPIAASAAANGSLIVVVPDAWPVGNAEVCASAENGHFAMCVDIVLSEAAGQIGAAGSDSGPAEPGQVPATGGSGSAPGTVSIAVVGAGGSGVGGSTGASVPVTGGTSSGAISSASGGTGGAGSGPSGSTTVSTGGASRETGGASGGSSGIPVGGSTGGTTASLVGTGGQQTTAGGTTSSMGGSAGLGGVPTTQVSTRDHEAIVRISCPAGWQLVETYPRGLTDADLNDDVEFVFAFDTGERREMTAYFMDEVGAYHWLFDFAPVDQGGSGVVGSPLCDVTLLIDGVDTALHYRPGPSDPNMCIYTNLAVDGSTSGTCI